MSIFSAHYADRTWAELSALLVLAAMLFAAALCGMAYVAGFGAVRQALAHAHWWWLGPVAGAVVIGFCGYYFAYRGVASIERGPNLRRPTLLAVVVVAFGGFLAHGSTAIDEFAMRAGGAKKREAKVRIGALAGFEYGILALIVCPASIAALVSGVVIPRTDLTWPWAVIPPPAFVLAIWAAERFHGRFKRRRGWRRTVGLFLETAHLVFEILRNPIRNSPAIAGMAIFWAADMFGLWAATKAFGFQMSLLSTVVAFGTGMLFTRRTAPLGGAGVMIVALVPTLWYGAAVPLAVATLSVSLYCLLTVGLPLPFSLAVIPRLRDLGQAARRSAQSGHD